MSQFGWPKFVGVCRPVMASVSAEFRTMLEAWAEVILAVRYLNIICYLVSERRGIELGAGQFTA